ncbi:hypothetical protein HK100_002861 [Physocladia obscura]|uniref:Uncharacterized protein n=1 Tax=Physocladia obscura TaxID=109957 RepID=A0AAD5SV74_9FUNG|nr:hypothetical protein HK100_002861 [Physocladia obscura]
MTSSTGPTPIPDEEAGKRPFSRLKTFFTPRSTTPAPLPAAQPPPLASTARTTTTTTAAPPTRHERGESFDHFPRFSPFQTPSTGAEIDAINYSHYANSFDSSSGETPVSAVATAAGIKVARTKSIAKRLQIEIPKLPSQLDQQYQWKQQHQQHQHQQHLRHVSSEGMLPSSNSAANAMTGFFPQPFGRIKSSPVEFIALPFKPPVGAGGGKRRSGSVPRRSATTTATGRYTDYRESLQFGKKVLSTNISDDSFLNNLHKSHTTSKAEMKVVIVQAEVCPPMPRVFKQPRTIRFSSSNSNMAAHPYQPQPQPSINSIGAALLQRTAVSCPTKPSPIVLQHHIRQPPVRPCVQQSRGATADLTSSVAAHHSSASPPIAPPPPSAPMGRTRPRLYSLRACDKPLIAFDFINCIDECNGGEMQTMSRVPAPIPSSKHFHRNSTPDGLLLPLPPRRARHSHSSPMLETLPSPALSDESPPPAMPSFSSLAAPTTATTTSTAVIRTNSMAMSAVMLSPTTNTIDPPPPPPLVIGPAPPSRQQAHAKPPRSRSLSKSARPRLPCLNDLDRPSMASLMLLLSDEPPN